MSDACDPMVCSPPGSSVRGILQARTLEWIAISLSLWASYLLCFRRAQKMDCLAPLGKSSVRSTLLAYQSVPNVLTSL